MKTLFVILAAIFTVNANAYVDSLKLSCAAAQSFIATRGAATLATGNVYAEISASPELMSVPAYVRTADERYCWVGFYSQGHHSQGAYTQGTDEACREGATVAVSAKTAGTEAPVTMVCHNGGWSAVAQ